MTTTLGLSTSCALWGAIIAYGTTGHVPSWLLMTLAAGVLIILWRET